MTKILLLKESYRAEKEDTVQHYGETVEPMLRTNTYISDGAKRADALVILNKDYQNTSTAAPRLSAEQTVLKNLALLALAEFLGAQAVDFNQQFAANEPALLSLGLPQVKANVKVKDLAAPTTFTLTDGPKPGTLTANCVRPDHAVSLEYFYTTDPNLPLDQWKSKTVRSGSVTIDVKDSALRVYVKVRGVGGDHDEQPFSELKYRVTQ